MLKVIYNSGYSRIPVWKKDPNDVVGIVFTKDLIYVDPNENVPLIAFARVFAVAAHRIWLDAELGEVLSVFKVGSTHMALVYDVNNWGPVSLARLLLDVTQIRRVWYILTFWSV